MQRRIREFIADYNQRTGASVLLSSHYMADVEALCRRVVVIHHGRILYDGELSALVQRFASHKTIKLELSDEGRPSEELDLHRYGEVVESRGGRATLRIPKSETAAMTARLLSELEVKDLTVEDPPIEEVIERVFNAEAE